MSSSTSRQKRAYQRAYMNYATPQLLDIAIQGVARAGAAGNIEALKQLIKILGLTEPVSEIRPMIQVNQNNASRNEPQVSVEEGKNLLSFDQVVRSRDEDRRRRLAPPEEVIDTSVEAG